MNEIHFASLDLNLLRVFDVLFHTRSVTLTGDRLGLTPSAVSHALGRLRLLFQDELFVRTSDGMTATQRAKEIGARLHQALEQIQSVLVPEEFRPESTERQFVVACSPYVSTVMLPHVLERVRHEAPHAVVRVRPTHLGVAEELESGRMNIAIGGFEHVPDRFGSETLLSEVLVWALRADHPQAGERLTIERLAAIPHIVRGIPDEAVQEADALVLEHGLERRIMQNDRDALQAALKAHGLKRTVCAVVPDSRTALAVVARTDMAALVPRRIAVAVAGWYGLRLFEPPYASPPIEIKLVWRNSDGNPATAWLRRICCEIAASL